MYEIALSVELVWCSIGFLLGVVSVLVLGAWLVYRSTKQRTKETAQPNQGRERIVEEVLRRVIQESNIERAHE